MNYSQRDALDDLKRAIARCEEVNVLVAIKKPEDDRASLIIDYNVLESAGIVVFVLHSSDTPNQAFIYNEDDEV
jgi:hypothetical protein